MGLTFSLQVDSFQMLVMNNYSVWLITTYGGVISGKILDNNRLVHYLNVAIFTEQG